MRGRAVIPWVTVETLTPEGFSVASVGGTARDFADWRRVLQRQLARTPALYDGLTTRDITDAVCASAERAIGVDKTFATKAGPHRLITHPIYGPAGDVHAVQWWAGPAAGPLPPPPAAVGAVWELDSQTLAQPPGIRVLSGVAPEEYVPRMSIAEFFYRISGFDRHAEVLDLLYRPESGAKLQFEVSMVRPARRATRWRITIRARDDDRVRGAWWLIEDITAEDDPAVWPTLESVGLREAHRRAGNHLAVIQLAHTTLSHWLTEPAPWIRWDYLFRPVDVFHPADRPRLIEQSARVRAGESAEVVVRTLDYSGGYTPTSLLLYPYPGFSNRELAIAHTTRAGSEYPFADSAGRSGVGPPPGPLGYDDQLRHWLTVQPQHSRVN